MFKLVFRPSFHVRSLYIGAQVGLAKSGAQKGRSYNYADGRAFDAGGEAWIAYGKVLMTMARLTGDQHSIGVLTILNDQGHRGCCSFVPDGHGHNTLSASSSGQVLLGYISITAAESVLLVNSQLYFL